MTNTTRSTTAATRPGCDRDAAVTRSLLAYGVIAGPFYLVVGVAQALTRDGFDLARHDLSLLANGPWGWVQITNLVVTGLMCVTAAAGARRALRGGRGGTWGPRLIGLYGAGLVAGGVFVADPMGGFPPGAVAGAAAPSWHGMLHMAGGAVGFLALVAACFVLAGRFAGQGHPGWAWYSRATGIVVLGGFGGVASGAAGPVAVLGLWVGVVAGWVWLAALSVHLYRRAAPGSPTRATTAPRRTTA